MCKIRAEINSKFTRNLLSIFFFGFCFANYKQNIIQVFCLFAKNIKLTNFKLSFTRKNWLLKFGFVKRLAQILEPKLLVHEILKFAWHLPDDKAHAVRSAGACTLNVRGVFTSTSSRNCEQRRDLKRGIRGRLRNSSPLVSLFNKFISQNKF